MEITLMPLLNSKFLDIELKMLYHFETVLETAACTLHTHRANNFHLFLFNKINIYYVCQRGYVFALLVCPWMNFDDIFEGVGWEIRFWW